MAIDAQFSNVKIMRPPDGFEEIYQGKAGQQPVPIVPNYLPNGRDEQVRLPGFDSNLLGGLPLPLGSRIVMWVPQIRAPAFAVQPADLISYRFRVVFRLRNANDFVVPTKGGQRKPYHYPKETPGQPDSTASGDQQRFVLPAATHVLGTENVGNALSATDRELRLVTEFIVPRFQPPFEPLLSDGMGGSVTGIQQQGILDPGNSPLGAFPNIPGFVPFVLDSMGDDMFLLVDKVPPQNGGSSQFWDFTTGNEDLLFSDFFGTGNGAHGQFRDLGVFVMTGANP